MARRKAERRSDRETPGWRLLVMNPGRGLTGQGTRAAVDSEPMRAEPLSIPPLPSHNNGRTVTMTNGGSTAGSDTYQGVVAGSGSYEGGGSPSGSETCANGGTVAGSGGFENGGGATTGAGP